MAVDVLLGLQWGDEGKGKIVDYLAPSYQVVARFQGGPNAGHTLKIDGKCIVLHTIPSGIFHEELLNLIGNGVVIDPVEFDKETNELAALGLTLKNKLFISYRAHLILPTHRLLDAASELSKGEHKIGSTLRGIGPAYMDKTGRNGLRVGDLMAADFQNRYKIIRERHVGMLQSYGHDLSKLVEMEKQWMDSLSKLKSFPIVAGEHFIEEQLANEKKILAEGAQGSMLDIDFGTYPYVTSSSTIAAGACTGLGVAPSKIGEVFGVMKAYCTRVGSGPFPTELKDETGELMRKQGGEFGATTGRARRCGWLDLPALNYAIQLSGVTQLIITKADVLSVFDEINVCTAYQTLSRQIFKEMNEFSYDLNEVKPVYETLPGWKNAVLLKSDVLPESLQLYVSFIERQTHVPVTMISTGAGREELFLMKEAVATNEK
jgi:adenylosuccinate synthase